MSERDNEEHEAEAVSQQAKKHGQQRDGWRGQHVTGKHGKADIHHRGDETFRAGNDHCVA